MLSCEFCKIFKNTYYVKQKWTAVKNQVYYWIQLNSFPNSNLMTSVIFAHKIRNAYTVKNTKFYQKQLPKGVQVCNFIKKESLVQVFSWRFCQISKTTFSYRTPLVAASVLWWWSFFFNVEAFQFSKFYKNVDKLHESNFKRSLTMTFKVKNS